MKKYISLFAAVAVMLSMAGCADNNTWSDSPATDGSSTTGGSVSDDVPMGTASGTSPAEPSTTAAYNGLEIKEDGGAAEVVDSSTKGEGGFLDGIFGGSDDLEYAAAEAVDGGFDMIADTAAPSAPTAAPIAPAEDYICIEPDIPFEEDYRIEPLPEPQAGLLTGGEWNDNDHWYEWISLYQSHEEWNSFRDTWRIDFDTRQEVIVTAGGVPVEGAKVTIYPDSDCIDTAITDNNGRAYLFRRNGDDIGTIDVVYGDTGVILDDVDLSKDGSHSIELSADTVISDPVGLDLMLMVDTTGSMMDELSYLQAELQDVIERVSEGNGNIPIRVSVNFYRDEGDEYIVRYYPFTSDIDLAVDTIGEQEAMGGGDTPEAVHSAMDVAINEHEWNEGAVKLMFFVLDAPPHSDTQIVDSVNSLTAQAAEKGIRIIPVASSGIDKSTEYLLRTMAFSTGGTYTFLTDDSGIGGSHIEPTIGDYDVENLNDMMVRIISEYLE